MKTPSTARSRQILYAIPVLVLLLSGVVLFVYEWQRDAARERVFRTWVDGSAEQVDSALTRFFEPVVTNLRIAREWRKDTPHDPEKIGKANARFMPILDAIPQISSMMIANTRGQEYMLKRTPDGWLTRLTDRDRWGDRTLWQTWSPNGESLREEWKEVEYDPCGRPWFSGAIEARAEQDPYWTEPYTFFTAKKPGITASLLWRDTTGGITHVVGFDVLLLDLSTHTINAKLPSGGRAFVFTEDSRVLGLPRDQRYQDPVAVERDVLKPVLKLGLPDLEASVRQWISGVHGKEEVFPLALKAGPGWAGFRPLQLGNRRLWLGVVMPESVLLDEIGGIPHLVSTTIVLLGLLGFAVSILLVRRHNRQITRESRHLIEAELARESDASATPAHVLRLIRRGESEQLEFKSTVRFNLKAGKPGKEIEIAWLKGVVGFLNTDGGVLLIGVDDDGQVIGIDPDNFANDDKALRHIDNLISQHIGLEFVPFIRFGLVEVEGRKVVQIRCRRSDSPAFLTNGRNEDFYVRTGPASRKLQPSQILKYVETRKSGDS